ncbi:hypothetical protein I7I53_06441 [Histoplasma capsulatum var. duboisii H88]|uniref:Uncharacterized protein n=1 Tax=Ajellomyces capsulatus (strain H88) TaxID=544711 RepID=A0A8A1L9U4_AJEC8|nr:hypothetical protein I7I53_06441 [Histoplasma capsulatum var. duboisii H88]
MDISADNIPMSRNFNLKKSFSYLLQQSPSKMTITDYIYNSLLLAKVLYWYILSLHLNISIPLISSLYRI